MEWRTCIGFPDYAISEDGQVVRTGGGPGARVGNILKPSSSAGYRHVVLCVNGKRITRTIHTLVARAFLGDPPTAMHQAAHGDGDRKNNHHLNLRWATPIENAGDRLRHGTLHIRTWNSKLSADDAVNIRALATSGVTQRAIANQYGVQASHIGKVVRGLKWRQNYPQVC